jgi:general stress protein 26
VTDINTDLKDLKSDMWKKMADSPFVMVGPEDGSTHSEPLTVQLDKDQVDTLFFFVGKDNRIVGKEKLTLQFFSKEHDFFASIRGNGRIDDDRAQIDKLWNKHVEAWFPDDKDDANLALLRVDIDGAELWETDISVLGRTKMLFGGTIKAGEAGSHAVVQTTAESSNA